MASRKRPLDVDAKLRPGGLTLREQLKALPQPELPKAPPKVPPKPPAERLRPDVASFKQLAADIAPLAPTSRFALPPELPLGPPPAPAVVRGEASKPKLWVERNEQSVRARAPDVPARLSKELESGRVVPRRVLDLHGRNAIEARQLLDAGIRQARRDGLTCVLVVCGRGTHSGVDGPVLPELAIGRLSEELADDVLAFSSAPRKLGGQGALIVRLRGL
jgi:DNA-nicking Smr family endonuclease